MNLKYPKPINGYTEITMVKSEPYKILPCFLSMGVELNHPCVLVKILITIQLVEG